MIDIDFSVVGDFSIAQIWAALGILIMFVTIVIGIAISEREKTDRENDEDS